MDRVAGSEKLHAMLIERRRLLGELEHLSRMSRECIAESRKTIARVERMHAEPSKVWHDGRWK